MKKVLCMVMVLAMMFGLSAQTALAAKGDKAVTKQTAVVLVKTPLYKTATGSSRVLTLSKGKAVTVKTVNGKRYKVTYGKRTGYVIKSKLKLIPNDTVMKKQTAKTSAKTYLYTNVYSGKKLVTLKKNAKLTITAKNGKYYKVKYGSKTGYVLKTKVTLVTATATPTVTVKPTTKPTATPKPTAAAAPTATPKPTTAPTPKPTTAPTPTPTTQPTVAPQIEDMGSGYANQVLAAVNESRADYGNGAMTLDSGLCAKALAHAKEMALRGEIFHSCSGAEAVSNSTESGRSIGIRSAAHATGLALDADRSRLGVGSVKYNGVQYTCVFSPRD